MSKKVYNVFVACLVFYILFSHTVVLCSTAYGVSQHQRIFGSDRYRTAVAISQKGWEKSDYVVIARGDDFADALCAGPLAKKLDAPILLTRPDGLSGDTLTEIKRLGACHVLIVGGTGAVSGSVENTLRLAGIHDIERIYGSDRYETSVKIAEKLGSIDRVFIVTGLDYPDALSTSVIASKLCIPILLTEKNSLPKIVEQYINERKVVKSYVLGGTGVVSDRVKNTIPNSTRLGGRDRYETNILVMQEFSNVLSFTEIFVADGEGVNGSEFPDALSGAILAAKKSSPVILVYKALPDITESFIKSKVSAQSRVSAFGGEAAVPSSVLNTIESYIHGEMAADRGEGTGSWGVVDSSQSLVLSWSVASGPSGYKYAGEEVDIGININLANSYGTAEGIDLVMVCRKELDGQNVTIGVGEVTVISQGSEITASESGIYQFLQSANIDKPISVSVRAVFNYPGNYKLNVYAVKNN